MHLSESPEFLFLSPLLFADFNCNLQTTRRQVDSGQPYRFHEAEVVRVYDFIKIVNPQRRLKV